MTTSCYPPRMRLLAVRRGGRSSICCGMPSGFWLAKGSPRHNSHGSMNALPCPLPSPVLDTRGLFGRGRSSRLTSQGSWQLSEESAAPGYFQASVKWVKMNSSEKFLKQQQQQTNQANNKTCRNKPEEYSSPAEQLAF